MAEFARLLKAGSITAGYADEMWTLARISALIQARFKVRFASSSLWSLLNRMGWSVQRPARQGRTIVFIDESGLSERPCRARIWAPRGETPVLQYSFSWKQLSVIAGVSFVRFYFRLFAGAIRSPQVVEFLKTLTQIIDRKP